MSWPTGQEYSDAIQNPRSAFEDAELQGGRIETDRLGLPKPRSGSFAVVYRIDCGARSWAVKCFTREVPDQQARYAAISSHLRALNVPYMVGFDYLPRGIRIRGQWYSILKMEWVSGESLIRYVDANLRDPASLMRLAARWVAMLGALRTAGIAHGDLQHGNVLVVGSDLKLVDYDGMFVPALAGTGATEVGHPNYQHPGRASLVFGPTLDNFSSWTVYVSLVALSLDPSLWSRVKAGDECLLFRASDFAAPETSQVFAALTSSSDERLRCLIEVYKELLRLRVEQVPPLDAGKVPIGGVPPSPHRQPAWLSDHIGGTGGVPVVARGTPQESEIDASWVFDFIAPMPAPEDADFVHGVLLLRLTALVSLVVITAAMVASDGRGYALFATTALVAFNCGLFVTRYRREPGLASLQSARWALKNLGNRVKSAEGELREVERQRAQRIAQRDRDVGAVESRIRAASEQARREIEAVAHRAKAHSVRGQQRRQQINSEEQRLLANIAQRIGSRVFDLRNQLAGLSQEESKESGDALKALQDTHVRNVLSTVGVAQAQIRGVGYQLTRALMENGITSAHDVASWKISRIPGFGPTRVKAVCAWASQAETRARATMPRSLSASAARAIHLKYENRLQSLRAALQPLESQQSSEEAAVRSKYGAMRQEVDAAETAANAVAQRETQVVQERLDQVLKPLTDEKERIIEIATRALATFDAKTTAMRRRLFGIRMEQARASGRVKTYAGLKFSSYVRHLAVGSRAARERRAG